MNSLGFTGSQIFDKNDLSFQHLSESLKSLINRYDPDTIVTGACVGYDAAIHSWFEANAPTIHRRVIVPANHAKVSVGVLYDPHAEFIRMPHGTSYRARNEVIVENSKRVAAFWSGQRVKSGTFMTMNIALKIGKLDINDIFGVGVISDEEARFLYANGNP